MPKASGQWSSVEREAHSIMSMQYLCIRYACILPRLHRLQAVAFAVPTEERALLEPVLAEQSVC